MEIRQRAAQARTDAVGRDGDGDELLLPEGSRASGGEEGIELLLPVVRAGTSSSFQRGRSVSMVRWKMLGK